MYIPWLFEHHHFKRFGSLLGKARPQPTPPEVHEFLFRASSVRLAERRIEELKRHAEHKFRRHRRQLRLDRDPVEFWSEEVVDVAGQLTFAVGQLRIMQNLLVAILARLQALTDVPSSLSDLIKAGPETYGFKAELAAALKDYWHAGGSTLKHYRDLDDHFFAIARHSVMRLGPPEEMSVYLPDDPAERSRARAAFSGRVNGSEFLRRTFVQLEAVADCCLEFLGLPPAPLPLVAELGPVTAKRDTESTIAVGIPGEIGTTALQVRFDPDRSELVAEAVELPGNDPKDCPVPLYGIVDFLRRDVPAYAELTADDVKYVGSPDLMLSVAGIELGGPWQVWLWRVDHKGKAALVVVNVDEECPRIAYQGLPEDKDPQEVMAELLHRTVLHRKRRMPARAQEPTTPMTS
jgi:hypothetical protein